MAPQLSTPDRLVVPSPEEIRALMQERREELRALRRLLKLTEAATDAAPAFAANARQEVEVRRGR